MQFGRKLPTFWSNHLHPFLGQKNQPYTVEETEEFKKLLNEEFKDLWFSTDIISVTISHKAGTFTKQEMRAKVWAEIFK